MNRPREQDRGRVRSDRLVIRLRPRERERWKEKAQASKMSLAEWVRDACNRSARM
jgi:predicted HicB family RNase H-like nuclease